MLAVPKTSTCVGVPSGVTTVAVTVALIVATPGLTAVTKPLAGIEVRQSWSDDDRWSGSQEKLIHLGHLK